MNIILETPIEFILKSWGRFLFLFLIKKKIIPAFIQ